MKNKIKITVPGQTLELNDSQTLQLQAILDFSRILSYVVSKLRNAEELVTESNQQKTIHISCKAEVKIMFSQMVFDFSSLHLQLYESRNMACFLMVKTELAKLGFTVIEQENNTELVWFVKNEATAS